MVIKKELIYFLIFISLLILSSMFTLLILFEKRVHVVESKSKEMFQDILRSTTKEIIKPEISSITRNISNGSLFNLKKKFGRYLPEPPGVREIHAHNRPLTEPDGIPHHHLSPPELDEIHDHHLSLQDNDEINREHTPPEPGELHRLHHPQRKEEFGRLHPVLFTSEGKKILEIRSGNNRENGEQLFKREILLAEKGGGDEIFTEKGNYWFVYVVRIPGSKYWYGVTVKLNEAIADMDKIFTQVFQFHRYIVLGILCSSIIMLLLILAISIPVFKRITDLEKENIRKNRHLNDTVSRLNGEVAIRRKVEVELKTANNELKLMSNTDGLTGISNRRLFDDMLGREWFRHQRREKEMSLILCDIDAFKEFNDTYGHIAGDSCLKQIAETISLSCKRPSDFIARYGGEEFVVILGETGGDGACKVAERIREEIIGLGIQHESSPVTDVVSISLGIATMLPLPGNDHNLILNNADKALYRAKNLGRNRVESWVP